MVTKESKNHNLDHLQTDALYHLGLDTNMDLQSMFGHIKYVCMSGSAVRITRFTKQVAEELELGISPADIKPVGKTERFTMYTVGDVLTVSHGMGMPSILILLHELTKLLEYAGAKDVAYIRIGTSGGIGLAPGTVVVTTKSLNGKLEPLYRQIVLGKDVEYPSTLNESLTSDIMATKKDIPVELGMTLSTNDFYEEEGHLDGALLPPYTKKEVNDFNQRLLDSGVKNIEMESGAFAAFTLRAGIPAAVVCATLTDRFDGDQIPFSKEELKKFSDNAQNLVLQFLKEKHGVL